MYHTAYPDELAVTDLVSTGRLINQDRKWYERPSAGVCGGNFLTVSALREMNKSWIFTVIKFQCTCISCLISYIWDLKALSSVYAKI